MYIYRRTCVVSSGLVPGTQLLPSHTSPAELQRGYECVQQIGGTPSESQ